REPLRSGGAPTVLRPRHRWAVRCRPLCGSEPSSHHSRTVSSASSWTYVRLRRQLSELLVRHVGNDRSERLAVSAESPSGILGGPARCLGCRTWPATRVLSCARSEGPGGHAHVRGPIINRGWSDWLDVPCEL